MTAILVTGASGFVGLAVSEALAGLGCKIVGFDIAPPKLLGFDWMELLLFVRGDIRDSAALDAVLTEHAITHIVHAAALTPDERRERDAPDTIAEVNIVGACRLALAASRRSVRRVVYLSSVSAYGPVAPQPNGSYDERYTSAAPEVLYGITKLAAETAMRRIAVLNGMDLRVIRLGPLFGPWEHASGARDILSPHFQIAAAARSGVHCVIPRAVPADWLYARDGAGRVAALLLKRDLDGDLFNLGGGTISMLTDWCKTLAALLPGFTWSVDPAAPTIHYGYPTDRPALDNTRIDAALPGLKSLPLEEAARDYLAWLDTIESFAPKMEPAS
jgi:nucleoside-diphosphate-sugar epimerase